MKLLWSVAKWFLFAWGIVSFIAVTSIGGFLAFHSGPGNKESTKTASKRDVRFVLNWCGLGEERIAEVLHSYVSARSFTGDHLDAHAIRITHVDASELIRDETGTGWTRGDLVEGILDDAMQFAEAWLPGDDVSWFPSRHQLRSDQIYVYPWSIHCHGTRPTAVELIFVRPRDKMVFFLSGKV